MIFFSPWWVISSMVWKTSGWKTLQYQPYFSSCFIVHDVKTWRSAIPYLYNLFQAICHQMYKAYLFMGRNRSYWRLPAPSERVHRSSDAILYALCYFFFPLLQQDVRWNPELVERSENTTHSRLLIELKVALRHCNAALRLLVTDDSKYISVLRLIRCPLVFSYDGSCARSRVWNSINSTQRNGENIWWMKFLVLYLSPLLL